MKDYTPLTLHHTLTVPQENVFACKGDEINAGRNDPAVETLSNVIVDQLMQGNSVHLMGHSQGGAEISAD